MNSNNNNDTKISCHKQKHFYKLNATFIAQLLQ